MSFDFKKEYKEFYMPPKKPGIVTVPPMNYIAVRGKGDPNDENGEYKNSISLLYGIAFTIKMSYKGERREKNTKEPNCKHTVSRTLCASHKAEEIIVAKPDGYFDYVVPPLEGLWWQDGTNGIDYAHKDDLNFISLIRLPDFVKRADFDWAVNEAERKKKTDFSAVEFVTYNEGKCIQCMHIGSYDSEPETIALMHEYAAQNGYAPDITETRYHHEIYISDPRRCDVNKLKTVIRHPIKKNGGNT